MKIIKLLDVSFPYLVDALALGKTVVYPTETCYGLGCDATNAEAVEKIYRIKERPKEKSLMVIVASLEMMAPYVEMSETLSLIAKKYWPGPLTVVVPMLTSPPPERLTSSARTNPPERCRAGVHSDGSSRAGYPLPRGEGAVLPLADGVIRDDGTIAFRVTGHPFAASLSRALGGPIVSTSANVAGGPNPYRIEDVARAFRDNRDQPDILIDAGELLQRRPSTVVRLRGDTIEVLRQGDIVIDDESK